MTKIKLCGLRRKEDIIAVNELEPDYIGFVFVPKSKRFVSLQVALEHRKLLKESIVSVGVFMDHPMEEVFDYIDSGTVSVAQLHGNCDNNYIDTLKDKRDITVIKAFGIEDQSDIKKANESVADYVLLDNPKAGSGSTFDHSLLALMKRPYFLAGGLGFDNVGELIDKYNPYGVDVSSKIETDGIKDKNKMKAFVRAVRERS